MDTPNKATAKDVFLHLLQTVTLYVSVVSFLVLLAQYVNALFPDPLNNNLISVYNSIRWSTSILLVMFPVFIILSWLIGRDYRTVPEKRNLRVRMGLIYVTLFASSITVIIALIAMIYNYLSGELSTRFLLKVLAVVIVAAAVFGYYIWDLKRKDFASKKPKLWAWISGLVILGSIVGGFFIVGTPSQQRAKRFDDQRSNDLSQIENQVTNFYAQKGYVPSNLSEVEQLFNYPLPRDPETNQSYEYMLIGQSAKAFELCATFNAKSDGTSSIGRYPAMPYPAGDIFDPYQHDAGHQCFQAAIDPSLYKPVPK